MSSEERRKILQMVQDGRISAEQAANLMRALDADSDPAEAEVEVVEAGASSGYERNDAPEFEQVKSRARRLRLLRSRCCAQWFCPSLLRPRSPMMAPTTRRLWR